MLGVGGAQFFPFFVDYTLVTYTEELLELIYDMALKRLVEEKEYPREMLESGLTFDPQFSIRGLAVDRENGWVCHLSYTHKVAAAWEGRHRVDRKRLMEEYSGKRALTPSERRKRLRPLNDLFSMAECCLMADTGRCGCGLRTSKQITNLRMSKPATSSSVLPGQRNPFLCEVCSE